MHFSNIGTLQLYYPTSSENKQQVSARGIGSSDGKNQVDGNLTGMTTTNSYSIITTGLSIVKYHGLQVASIQRARGNGYVDLDRLFSSVKIRKDKHEIRLFVVFTSTPWKANGIFEGVGGGVSKAKIS